jgi:hypothetical protein
MLDSYSGLGFNRSMQQPNQYSGSEGTRPMGGCVCTERMPPLTSNTVSHISFHIVDNT